MKNKTKTTKKTNAPVLSRLSLKTFIIIAAFTVFISALMSVKFYYDISQMGHSFSFAMHTLYPAVTVIGPLVSFGIVYMISKEKVTKLWRVSKAAIVASIASMFQTFITPINMSAFAKPMGYVDTPPVAFVYLFEALPVILAVILSVGLSLLLSKSKAARVSDASKLLQKLFLGGVLVFGLGQAVVSVTRQIGGPMPQPIEVLVFDLLTSLIVPAIILSVLFLVVSRQRSTLERFFIAVFYAVIGVMLLIALSPIPYLFSSPTQSSFNASWGVMYLPGVVAFGAFIGIVAWHKLKKAI